MGKRIRSPSKSQCIHLGSPYKPRPRIDHPVKVNSLDEKATMLDPPIINKSTSVHNTSFTAIDGATIWTKGKPVCKVDSKTVHGNKGDVKSAPKSNKCRCDCGHSLCFDIRTRYHSVGINVKPLTSNKKGKQGVKIYESVQPWAPMRDRVYIAPYHLEGLCRAVYKTKPRGIISLLTAQSIYLPADSYITTNSETDVLAIPLRTDDHMRRALAECFYYCTFINKKPELRDRVAVVINRGVTKHLKPGKEIAPSEVYSLYTTFQQKELKTCHPTQRLSVLAKIYSQPSLENPIDMEGTIEATIKFRETNLPRDPVSIKEPAGSNLPSPFYKKVKKTKYLDSAEVGNKKKALPLDVRMKNVAVEVFDNQNSGTRMFLNLKDREKIKNSLLPLREITSSYSTIEPTSDIPPPSGIIYWQNKQIKGKLTQAKCKQSGTIVYVDKGEGIEDSKIQKLGHLRLGRNQMYVRVGDYLNEKEIQDLCRMAVVTGRDAVPPLTQVKCSIVFLHAVKLLENKPPELRGEEKDFCDEATLLLKEFIQIIYQALIDFVPQLDDSGVLLERVEWILYCLMTKEFYDLVPRWQQELIDENHRMIELRVRKQYQDVPEEVFQLHLSRAIADATFFHYTVIMAVSQAMKDRRLFNIYCQLMYKVYDAQSFVEQIKRLGSFGRWYECICEIFRTSSLNTTKAETIIPLTLRHVLDGRDKATGIYLSSIYEISDKKQRISDNTRAMFSKDVSHFSKVGIDNHVYTAVGLCIQESMPESWRKTYRVSNELKYINHVIDNTSPETGLITNEMLAIIGQFIDRGEGRQLKLLDFIHEKVAANNNALDKMMSRWRNNDHNIKYRSN